MTTKHTALHEEHAKLGAVFTDFGGWDMPLRYGSELSEHTAVREAAGIFDLSHMGEVWVEGPDAASFLNAALVGNLAVVKVGKAKYSLMCDDRGGIIDDLIAYRRSPDRYLVVPNAGNTPAVVANLMKLAAGFDVSVTDASDSTSLIAVQGPRAVEILNDLVPENQRSLVSDMPYYAADEATVAGINILLARTGYTGEDGFELYAPNSQAVELWAALLESGESRGLVAAGLAARDSLRLEAGMPLYGNELSLEVNPFEAGLGPIVSFKKDEDFPGRDALAQAKEADLDYVLVGLKGQGRRAGRGGYAVLEQDRAPGDDRRIGRITSGQPSPTLGYPIALAFVHPAYATVGTNVDVDLRGKREPFEVVALPFYERDR